MGIEKIEFLSLYEEEHWLYNFLRKVMFEKKVVLLMHNDEAVALIDASNFEKDINWSVRHSSLRVNKKDLTFVKIHWYDPAFGEIAYCSTPRELFAPFEKIYDMAEKIAVKIRNALHEQYPHKEIKYEFAAKMPEVTFDFMKKCISRTVAWAELHPLCNDDEEIIGAVVSIEVDDPEQHIEKIKDTTKSFFEKKFGKQGDVLPVSLKRIQLRDFPCTAKVHKALPILDLLKKLPESPEILLIFGECIKSITWLYKISESTTGIPENRFMQEFHVFLLDLSSPFLRLKSRKINGRTYPGYGYIYGVNYLSEEKFFKILDAAIPYPTVFILRLSEEVISYDSSNKKTTKVKYIYQVWSGLKSAAGAKVNRYYHSDWLPESRFALTLQGENIKDAFNNIHLQIIHLTDK